MPEQPRGELVIQTIAMPTDTNPNGDIFGGWVTSQMDLGSGILAAKTAKSACCYRRDGGDVVSSAGAGRGHS